LGAEIGEGGAEAEVRFEEVHGDGSGGSGGRRSGAAGDARESIVDEPADGGIAGNPVVDRRIRRGGELIPDIARGVEVRIGGRLDAAIVLGNAGPEGPVADKKIGVQRGQHRIGRYCI